MQQSKITCTNLMEVAWQPWSLCPFSDGMAVFRYQITEDTADLPALTAMLQPAEIQRSARFHKAADRQRFVYARAILRILSGMYLNELPERIQLTTGLTRKPTLVNNAGWHINVSHSGSCILVAIGVVPVGVDIENIQATFAFQDLLPTSFSAMEQVYVGADEDSRRRFYELWTRKEALVKATGKGIDEAFSQIPSVPGQYSVDSRLLGESGDWTITSFPVAADYAAALAYRSTISIPKFYTLDSVLFEEKKS